MLITDLFARYSEQTPQKFAFVSPQASIRYSEFHLSMNKIANALRLLEQKHPVNRQRKIALLLNNRSELLQIFFAAAKIGWLSFILDYKWTIADMKTTLLECGPDVLIVEESYYRRLQDIPAHTIVVLLSSSENSPQGQDTMSFAQWISTASEVEPQAEIDENTLFYVGYTSGTTGKPKGFLRAHCSWIESFQVSNTAFGIDALSHVIAPGPLVHSLSLYAAASTLFAGATFYGVERFEAKEILALLTTQPISHIFLVPTMFEALYQEKHRETSPVPVQNLRSIISTGDKWSTASKERVASVFPAAKLYEFYGASELSFVTILDPEGNKIHPESVGRPASGVHISIRDPQGQQLPVGEIGQLYVQSKMLFSGYYLNDEDTREIMRDGWATVGDIARQDEEQFVYIVGRKNNMIISGGLNIYPEEVESVLLQLPSIDEAAVIGFPDTYWGEKVMALLKLKPGAKLDSEAILTHCRAHLARYKCPRHILQVADFPHTHSGKIARVLVKEHLLARATDMQSQL